MEEQICGGQSEILVEKEKREMRVWGGGGGGEEKLNFI